MITGLIVIWTYNSMNTDLNVETVLSIIALFNVGVHPLRGFSIAILNFMATFAACERINHLLNAEEIIEYVDDTTLEVGSLEIKNGTFSWSSKEVREYFSDVKNGNPIKNPKVTVDKKDSKKFEGGNENVGFLALAGALKDIYEIPKILRDINYSFEPGQFYVIIGKVGCGKSSLISCMINEMVVNSGSVRRRGKIGYIPQEAFMLNTSIRDNITFGCDYDKEFYEKVIDACQLRHDLNMLDAGDMTEIGERGINLSGGQKQRISIARAVYSQSDIYLIDDALSALDAYVGKKIFYDVFKGILKTKTKIMVTHHLHVLEHVDQILLMKNGKIVLGGKFSDIMDQQNYKEFTAETLKERTVASLSAIGDFGIQNIIHAEELIIDLEKLEKKYSTEIQNDPELADTFKSKRKMTSEIKENYEWRQSMDEKKIGANDIEIIESKKVPKKHSLQSKRKNSGSNSSKEEIEE